MKYLEMYAAEFRLPYQGGTRVVDVAQQGKLFEIRCDTGATFTTHAVVASRIQPAVHPQHSWAGRVFQVLVCIARLIERQSLLPASVSWW